MDLVFLELLCWGGLLFFFWALKDGLGRVENDIESFGLFNLRPTMSAAGGRQYYRPEQVSEPIGSYRDAQIYRYIVIDGRTYQFDRVLPPESKAALQQDERCVAPGLVYLECGVNVTI
jgi:hypothetical protein